MKNMKQYMKFLFKITSAMLIAVCILLSIWGYDMKHEQEIAKAEKIRLAEQYKKQNRAFALGIYGYYIPYAELRNFYNENDLYGYLCFYRYKTGNELTLADVWEYLAVSIEYDSLEVKEEHRGKIREYTFYPEIQEYVDFMTAFFDDKNTVEARYVPYFGVNVENRYSKFLSERTQVLRDAIELNPAIEKYWSWWAPPFQLLDELIHKVVDPSYKMNLEITDERNYMFITPEAYATGHGSQQMSQIIE